jgi:hypothetical protein
MELSYNHAAGSPESRNDDVAVVVKDRDDLISTLENSHQILKDLSQQSTDAQKAHAALTIMLRRVKGGLHTIPPPKTNIPSTTTTNSQITEADHGKLAVLFRHTIERANLIIAPPPPYDDWSKLDTSTLDNPLFPANLVPEPISAMGAPPYGSLDVIGEMLDTPANLDWVSLSITYSG